MWKMRHGKRKAQAQEKSKHKTMDIVSILPMFFPSPDEYKYFTEIPQIGIVFFTITQSLYRVHGNFPKDISRCSKLLISSPHTRYVYKLDGIVRSRQKVLPRVIISRFVSCYLVYNWTHETTIIRIYHFKALIIHTML